MSRAVAKLESSASQRIVRFGALEFNVQARELRKNGMRIKLSGQPLSILEMLLECPGEVVTREDLRKRLWPAGTYVACRNRRRAGRFTQHTPGSPGWRSDPFFGRPCFGQSFRGSGPGVFRGGDGRCAFVSLYYHRDWAKAEHEFRRAINLNPNCANGHHWYAEFLSLLGRHPEAIAESERARELDPLSNITNTWVGSRYFYAREYDKAIEQYRHAAEMDPDFVPVHLVLGQALEQKHTYQEAIAELERAVSLSGGSPVYLASLAHAYGVAGRRSEAQKTLQNLRNLSKQRYVSCYDLALASLGMGERDQALKLLSQAVEGHSPRAAWE
jgi:Tfp pilus assembly protein PilF